jgi:myo-inositol-1(or 4)-monophosphatase
LLLPHWLAKPANETTTEPFSKALSLRMINFAITIARQAGAILRYGVERERQVESKGHADVVTDIDKASEALLVSAIRERYPDHAIVAEEGSNSDGQSEYTWLIDPLDGTLNYLHGLPIYAVSLGLVRAGQPYLGVVYDPTRDELFVAERGRGAYLNGRQLQVSPTAQLNKALLTTGFPYDRFNRSENNLREFAHILLHVQDVRRPGSAALDLCYTAAGRSDGHWELGLKAWDVAAGAIIVSEAGGRLSDWQGNEWQIGQERLLATNGLIHDELLALLQA